MLRLSFFEGDACFYRCRFSLALKLYTIVLICLESPVTIYFSHTKAASSQIRARLSIDEPNLEIDIHRLRSQGFGEIDDRIDDFDRVLGRDLL